MIPAITNDINGDVPVSVVVALQKLINEINQRNAELERRIQKLEAGAI